MTVYLAALDETQNLKGDFAMGGWVAPEDDWNGYFVPAWDERVLGGRMPYLHMSDIWDPEWRDQHGITGSEAYWAVEEAATVLRTTGSLYPITSGMRLHDFRTLFADPLERLDSGDWEIVKDPDYLCYIALATLVLRYVYETLPDATRVNFLIEASEKTTESVRGFHGHLEHMLESRPGALALLGGLESAGKKSVPLQAADTLCWYVQRAQAGRLNKAEWRRFWMITHRQGHRHTHTPEDLTGLSEHLQAGVLARRGPNAGTPS